MKINTLNMMTEAKGKGDDNKENKKEKPEGVSKPVHQPLTDKCPV